MNHLSEKVESKCYYFHLLDLEGVKWKVKAFGVDSISREMEYVPSKEIVKQFADLTKEQLY